MNNILSLAEQVVVDRVLSNNPPVSGKTKAGVSFMLISAFFVFIGLAFLMYAGFLWLLRNYSFEEAALGVGLGSLLLAGVIGLISYITLKYRQAKIKQAKQDLIETMEAAIELADHEFSEPIRNNPKTSILVASVAGYVVGERFL